MASNHSNLIMVEGREFLMHTLQEKGQRCKLVASQAFYLERWAGTKVYYLSVVIDSSV